MKRVTALICAAALLWGCQSDPPLDAAKPGVEDRVAAPPAKPGPTSKPVDPTSRQDVTTVDTTKPQTKDGVDPRVREGILAKRSIFYDYDSDAIKEEYRPLLQAHAKYLAGNPNAKMLIQGNTDERGSREYNIALGQRRSEAAKRMLVLLGAREAQIDSVSLGEEKPRCNDQGEGCYSQNRRSDLLYGGEF